MAIPLPALDVQNPQIANPIDQMAKLSSLKSANLNQQLQGQELQQNANAMAQTKAINEAYAGALKPDANGTPTLDQDGLTKALASSGHGVAIPGILKSINDWQESRTKLADAKGKLQLQQKDMEGSLGFAIQQANYDPDLTHTILQRELADPNTGDQEKQQLQQVMQAIQQDPSTIKKVADGMVSQSPKQQELATSREGAEARGGPAMDYYRTLRRAGVEAGDAFKLVQTKSASPEAVKLDFMNIVGAMAKGGMTVDPTKITGAVLDQAQKKGIITSDQVGFAKGYMAANPTPTTQISVSTQEAGAKQELAQKKGYYLHEGKITRGDQLSDEDRAASLPVKDPEKAQTAISGTNATLGTFDRYRKAINDAKLSGDDVKALQVLTSPEKLAQGFLEKDTAGVLDSLFGEPLTGYSTKAMSGIMTKDQYDKLSPDGQKVLLHYYNSIISNFADMKRTQGGIGRNESQIQAEMHTIPLPYLGKDVANGMLDEKDKGVYERNIYTKGTQLPTRANPVTAPQTVPPAVTKPKGSRYEDQFPPHQ